MYYVHLYQLACQSDYEFLQHVEYLVDQCFSPEPSGSKQHHVKGLRNYIHPFRTEVWTTAAMRGCILRMLRAIDATVNSVAQLAINVVGPLHIRVV
jgi:hypothetical protein